MQGGVPNLINQAIGNANPMGQMAANFALQGVNSYIDKIQISGYTNKVFSPQLRAYFDVDTQTVKNKLLKLLLPFKNFQFDDQIKKLDLYLPIVSFMTLIMFSTLLEGITTEKFTPKIGNRTIWITIFTLIEVMLAKFTENAVSSLNLGVIQLVSLVSYRFVSLSIVVFILVVTTMSLPFLRYIGAIYALIVDTYYCKLQLSNCSRQRFKQQGGLGNQIALGVHVLTTIIIMWYSSII